MKLLQSPTLKQFLSAFSESHKVYKTNCLISNSSLDDRLVDSLYEIHEFQPLKMPKHQKAKRTMCTSHNNHNYIITSKQHLHREKQHPSKKR